ncbi:MAG: 4-alpha-glucanotransferase [Thermoguttaceae bacterium]|nr:4-alpha-glucanotransferase [Thermoguttaceae bacterium]
MSLPERSARREGGILLPIYSLPGSPFFGTLGENAYRFAAFLEEIHVGWWQMLPVTPIDPFYSPYSSCSAFAGETLYLDLEGMVRDDLLESADLTVIHKYRDPSYTDLTRVNYETGRLLLPSLWEKAYRRYKDGAGGRIHRREERFLYENDSWLDDYALFRLLADRFRTEEWTRWPEPYRMRSPSALRELRELAADSLRRIKFLQLLFDIQWTEFKEHCHRHRVRLLGDVPIYVAGAETWAHPELFLLNEDGSVPRIAGAPADDFNPDGQRWNLPLYRWDKMEEDGFDWWVRRIGKTLQRFDMIRLDHFIGFFNFYSFPTIINEFGPFPGEDLTCGLTPATSVDEQLGFWTLGPGQKLFDVLFARYDRGAFIAENLGTVTEGVERLRRRYNLPGMEVLQYSFDNRQDDPIPTWDAHSVACTGTHDTQTLCGWLSSLDGGWLDPELVKKTLLGYITDGPNSDPPTVKELAWGAMRAVLGCDCELALVPFQDVLGLGDSARMNTPGRCEGNWRWRLKYTADGQFLSQARREAFAELIRQCGRSSKKETV